MRFKALRVIICLSIKKAVFGGMAMKKLFAVLTALALLATCCVFAFADGEDEVYTGSCYRYKVLNDNEVSIVGFFGDGGYVSVAPSIGHRYVTSVGTSAFEFNTDLIGIHIPSRVTEIGDYAFHGCTDLIDITTPASVRSIGRYAFQSCNDLETIAVPEGITELKDGAFMFCPGLKSVSLPSTLEKIGSRAFEFCTSLESLTIPASVTEIAPNAFLDCSRLTLAVTEGSYAEQFAQEAEIPYTTAA